MKQELKTYAPLIALVTFVVFIIFALQLNAKTAERFEERVIYLPEEAKYISVDVPEDIPYMDTATILDENTYSYGDYIIEKRFVFTPFSGKKQKYYYVFKTAK